MSAHAAARMPVRLRRTTAVQWPNSGRSASGRPAATTRRPGRRSARSAARRSPGSATRSASSTSSRARRSHGPGRRARRRAWRRDRAATHGDGRGATTRTSPPGWASRHDGRQPHERRGAPGARRAGDEHVLAVGDAEHRRLERVEGDADDELQRRRRPTVDPAAGAAASTQVGEDADRRRTAGPAGEPHPNVGAEIGRLGLAAREPRRRGAPGSVPARGGPGPRRPPHSTRVVEVEHPPHRARRQHGRRHRAGPLGGEDGDDADGRPLGDEAGQRVGVGVVERVVEQRSAAPGARRRRARRPGRPAAPAAATRRRARRSAVAAAATVAPARAAAPRRRSGRARPSVVQARVATGVDDDDVERRRRGGRARGEEHRPQRRRRARRRRRRRRGGCRRPASRSSGSRRCSRRLVDQADRPGAATSSDVEMRGQRRQPRPVRRPHVAQRRGVADRAHEHGQLGVVGRLVVDGRSPSPTHAEARIGHPSRRSRAAGGLEHDVLARPEPQHRASRRPPRERGRGVVADDVAGVGDVVQAQGDAQVRVGPDVVADDAARPLRRQDEVDAEAAAALGDADQRIDEAGELGGQRRRTRRRPRRAAAAAVVRVTVRQSARSTAPTERSSRSRRRSSASRLTRARSASRSSRSVTTPTVCGSSAQASNVAPPL